MSLNPGQFSQPHLPGMHVKPTDEHRYPRGFTPDRKAEVDEALGARRNSAWRKDNGGYAEHSRETHYLNISVQQGLGRGPFAGHLAEGKPNPHMGRKEGEAKIAETIARSTSPVENLGATRIGVADPHDPKNESRGGYYRNWSDPGTKADVKTVVAPGAPPTAPLNSQQLGREGERFERQRQEQTLIHELGHHDSATRGTQHSVAYGGSATARGKEEAWADDFRSEHFRPDPRDQRRGAFDQSGYDRGGQIPSDPHAEDFSDHEQFRAGYARTRKHPIQAAPREQVLGKDQVGTYPSGMPKYKSDPDIEGQRRLFLRKGRLAEETSPDYGQHPLFKAEPTGEFYRDGYPKEVDVDLPTIKLGRGVPEKYR
jgi:hypothetical protein